MKLTSSSFFSMLFNGIPSRPLSPTWGILQGDPLSPFLFVIMVEGLWSSLSASISNGTLQGLPIHGLQPASSHNQFGDDTMLLNTPTSKEDTKLWTILLNFSEASSTTFNMEKSQFFFFNTPPAIQQHISHLLGIPGFSLSSNYLGLPLTDSTAQNISWNSLILSISNHLNSWTFRTLNLPARLILLKSMLQAILSYMFSALVAPQIVIKTIRNLQWNFLWHGHKQGKNGPWSVGKKSSNPPIWEDWVSTIQEILTMSWEKKSSGTR